MAISRPGIKRIAIADAGTMTGTPGNLIGIGLREPAALMITELDGYRDQRGRALRNKLNFKVEAKSFQISMTKLLNLIALHKSGVIDAQIYMERGQTSGNNENELFKFYEASGEYGGMGLDFAWVRNAKESYCTVTLECMKDYATGRTLINAATINAAMVPATVHSNERGEDWDDLQGVSGAVIMTLRDSAGVEYSFNLHELTDYELSIRTRGRKNVLNQTIAGVFEVQLSLTGADATVARIAALMGAGHDVALTFEYGQTQILFPASRLMHSEEITIGDEAREVKLTLKGDVPIEELNVAVNDLIAANIAPGNDLSGLDLSGRDLSTIDLSGCIMRGCRLVGTILNAGADLTDADLTDADLTDAMCEATDFTGATMPANADTKAEFKALVGSWDAEGTIWTDGEPIGE